MAENSNVTIRPDGVVELDLGVMKLEFPLLTEAPDHPEIGKNYKISPEGLTGAFGAQVYGGARKGKENKLAVIFCGGGVAFDKHMAARPFSLNDKVPENGYYSDDTGMMTDLMMCVGLAKDCPENPLRDWTVVWIPYNTGDFHTGTADVTVEDIEGKERTVHFHGWKNAQAILDVVKRNFIPEPEELLVTGFSAGGFATALLTDTLMGMFPSIQKCWCMPDGALMAWPGNQAIARDFWKAPASVWQGMTGKGFVLAPLLNLRKKHGEKVQLLYICSTRDAALCTFCCEDGIHRNPPATPKNADAFEAMLKEFVDTLTAAEPDTSIFLYDTPDAGYPVEDPEKAKVTQHTIIMTGTVYETRSDGKTVAEWLKETMEGKPQVLGKSLLR